MVGILGYGILLIFCVTKAQALVRKIIKNLINNIHIRWNQWYILLILECTWYMVTNANMWKILYCNMTIMLMYTSCYYAIYCAVLICTIDMYDVHIMSLFSQCIMNGASTIICTSHTNTQRRILCVSQRTLKVWFCSLEGVRLFLSWFCIFCSEFQNLLLELLVFPRATNDPQLTWKCLSVSFIRWIRGIHFRVWDHRSSTSVNCATHHTRYNT